MDNELKLKRVNELLHRNRHQSLHRRASQLPFRRRRPLPVSNRPIAPHSAPARSPDCCSFCVDDTMFEQFLSQLPPDLYSDNSFFSGIEAMPDIRPRKKSIPLVSELVLKVS